MAYVTVAGIKYKVGHPTYAPTTYRGFLTADWEHISWETATDGSSLAIYKSPLVPGTLACMFVKPNKQYPTFMALSRYEMRLVE